MNLTHLNNKGEAEMVDISSKKEVHREAEASGKIFLNNTTLKLIKEDQIKKGDVLSVARVAGISGAKSTSMLIPLCHNITINKIDIEFEIESDGILIKSKAVCDGRTGIEMEALTAVSVSALTIYDMCKAVDKNMIISEIKLEEKTKSELQY
ncbi:MAG: cyclic pyranopterin monophosphate synthase MoaC [Candidatus Aminicenantes bacterium]|nr:cyclic pyranopterin monophosphate synthase MoaC [Candidatus Aminicenantes bacterium]